MRFLREIRAHMGIMPGPTAVYIRRYALYVFGCRADLGEAVGMVKLFFYDQPYTDYRSAPYNQAYDLTQIGVMHDVAHVRSVIVDEAYRHSGVSLSVQRRDRSGAPAGRALFDCDN